MTDTPSTTSFGAEIKVVSCSLPALGNAAIERSSFLNNVPPAGTESEAH